MKKIPTLFERVYEDHKVVGIKSIVTPGFEWVLEGKGIATIKYDGSCCAIINGVFYKRYDAKKGKQPPAGAILCQPEPDPITGHWPHWVKVSKEKPEDKWYIAALEYSLNTGDYGITCNATYEAIGLHFQGNPYHLRMDALIRHGDAVIGLEDCPRSFEGIKEYLKCHYVEGIVFWLDGEPRCKIKRSDFGYIWGGEQNVN